MSYASGASATKICLADTPGRIPIVAMLNRDDSSHHWHGTGNEDRCDRDRLIELEVRKVD